MLKKIALLIVVIMLITPALVPAYGYGWYYWTGRDGTGSIWIDIGDWLGWWDSTNPTTTHPRILLPTVWEPIGADG